MFFPSQLTLAEKPTIRYPIDPRVSYNEGSPVDLQCTATGVPDPDVRWIRDGYVRPSGTNTTYFTISSIKKTDAGFYTCRGNNSAGSVIKQVYVTVNCKYLKDEVEAYQMHNLVYMWGVSPTVVTLQRIRSATLVRPRILTFILNVI